MSPQAHTVPSALNARVNFLPALTCLYVAKILVWLGTFIGANLSLPNCPSELYPNPQMLPSAFNVIAYPSPPATCGTNLASFSITLTITTCSSLESFSITLAQVVPTFLPVTSPLSSTVAMSSFIVLKSKSLSSSSSLNTLNVYLGVTWICLVPSTLTTISGSST